MTCKKCGAELQEGTKFCSFCGENQEIPDAIDDAAQAAGPTTCKKCGAELEAGARFCSSCGTNQEAPDAAAGVAQALESGKTALHNLSEKAAQAPILAEGIAYWRGFLSHDPTSEIARASSSTSIFWVLALAVNILLFSLAACVNIPQLLNHGWDSLIHSLIQCLKESVPGGRSLLFGLEEQIPHLDFTAFYSMFVPFVLISLVAFAIEVVGIYIPLLMLKSKPESISTLLNTICTSLFPITAVSVLNFLLGLIYPPLTICALIVAVFIHILLLYEGIKKTVKTNTSPIWQIGLAVLVICVIIMVVMGFAFTTVLGNLIDAIVNGALDRIASAFEGIFSGLLE